MASTLDKTIRDYIDGRTDWLVAKTVSFIKVRSMSGSEGEAAQLLARTLEESGLKAFIDGAGNVVAALGTARPEIGVKAKRLAFNVHLDTVPAGPSASWKHDPFGGTIEDGKIFGRGACDTKGAWAPMILAMEAVKNCGVRLAGEVIFTAVVMEELTYSIGMKVLLDSTLRENRPDYMILGEPTNLNLAIGHKGRTELEITTSGESCHASVPWEGENALYRAAKVISAVEGLAHEIASQPEDPLFGRSSVAMTNIVCSPGARNVIPDSCVMYVDYRFLPGETIETIESRVKGRLAEDHAVAEIRICEQDDTTYTGMRFRARKHMPGFNLEDTDPLVEMVSDAVGQALGRPPNLYRWNFATDGAYSMGALGIPTVGFSPCEEHQAHVVDEHVRIDSMAAAAKAYAAIILKLAG